jgi:hypothetical protein
MKIGIFAAAASVALVVGLAGAASAAPITLTGKYINTGVSDDGTLGSNGANSPGLQHDPTGNGNFGVNDYITPGSPHEGFSVSSTNGGYGENDNYYNGGGHFTTIVGPHAIVNGFDNAGSWTGSDGLLQITNDYFFNDGDQRVNVRTTLTALGDITGLAFARSVDPDPDVNTFGSFFTFNQRGNMLFGATDFVGSAGANTGLTLGLLNLSGDAFVHNTAIGNFSCCNSFNPFDVLTGFDGGNGDNSLNMAWLIGDLAMGHSAVINYAYVVGDNIGTVGGGVPEPATWAMMILGFGGIGATLRRRRLALSA